MLGVPGTNAPCFEVHSLDARMLLNPPALEHLSLNLGVPEGPQASGGSLTPILVREDHTTCPAPESSPDRQTEKCEAGPRGVPQMNWLSHTCRLVFYLQLWAAEHLLEPRSHLFAARALTSASPYELIRTAPPPVTLPSPEAWAAFVPWAPAVLRDSSLLAALLPSRLVCTS